MFEGSSASNFSYCLRYEAAKYMFGAPSQEEAVKRGMPAENASYLGQCTTSQTPANELSQKRIDEIAGCITSARRENASSPIPGSLLGIYAYFMIGAFGVGASLGGELSREEEGKKSPKTNATTTLTM